LKKEAGISLKVIGRETGVSLGAVSLYWVKTHNRIAQEPEFDKLRRLKNTKGLTLLFL
jgi:hypothetical protein